MCYNKTIQIKFYALVQLEVQASLGVPENFLATKEKNLEVLEHAKKIPPQHETRIMKNSILKRAWPLAKNIDSTLITNAMRTSLFIPGTGILRTDLRFWKPVPRHLGQIT